jgi:hypothetical protein
MKSADARRPTRWTSWRAGGPAQADGPYYIQLGLVDRPDGETRAARYGPRHVEQLLQVRKWSDAGVSLERIRELLSGEAPPVPPRPRRPARSSCGVTS